MKPKLIETELTVDFELILGWSRQEFVDHLKFRLTGNVDEIETVHYSPVRVQGGMIVLYIRAHRKVTLAEDGDAEDVKTSVLDSGAVLPLVGMVHNYGWEKWADGPPGAR